MLPKHLDDRMKGYDEHSPTHANTSRQIAWRSIEDLLKKHMTNKKQFTTIDEYIKTCPEDVQSILEKIRQPIRKAAPEAVETLV